MIFLFWPKQVTTIPGVTLTCDVFASFEALSALYNLEVQVKHTYFVADSGVLVHNGNECDKLYRGVPKNTERGRLAALGIVKPHGKKLDCGSIRKHVLNEDVDSGVTSWTKITKSLAFRMDQESGGRSIS